jgi:Collagen triple helix repeat (20 copies)
MNGLWTKAIGAAIAAFAALAIVAIASGDSRSVSGTFKTSSVSKYCVWVETKGNRETRGDLKDYLEYPGMKHVCIVGKQGKPGKNGTGVAGAPGPQGPQGVKGDTGAQGLKGDTGATGPAGATGAAGAPGAKGDTGTAGAKGDTGATGPAGATGPTGAAEFGLVSVFVDRGSGPTRWMTLSVGLSGSPAGTTTSGTFRFSCTPEQAPCKISFGAVVISPLSTEPTVVHPRLLIYKNPNTAPADTPILYCEYADGANNNAGLDTIQRVPTLAAASIAMNTPLSMGIGVSLDCGSTQTYSPEVTEIWVPAADDATPAFYDVTGTFAFSPGFDLPVGP